MLFRRPKVKPAAPAATAGDDAAASPQPMPPRPVLRGGDVVIERRPAGGAGVSGGSFIYQLHVHRSGTLPQRYATFDRAAMEGEALAQKNAVCLYYWDAPDQFPYLLRAFR